MKSRKINFFYPFMSAHTSQKIYRYILVILLLVAVGRLIPYLHIQTPSQKDVPVSVLWAYNIGSNVSTVPAVGDININGKLEIVVGAYDSTFYAIDAASGFLVWRYSVISTYKIYSSPTIVDIDNDGTPEVIFGGAEKGIYCLNGKTGEKEWVFYTSGWVESTPAIADINDDGNLEIVVGYMFVSTNEGGVLALDSIGNMLWNVSTGGTVEALQ